MAALYSHNLTVLYYTDTARTTRVATSLPSTISGESYCVMVQGGSHRPIVAEARGRYMWDWWSKMWPRESRSSEWLRFHLFLPFLPFRNSSTLSFSTSANRRTQYNTIQIITYNSSKVSNCYMFR